MSASSELSKLAFQAVAAAEAAAIAAHAWIGRGEKESADQAAVDALRNHLNAMPMKGRIVIGEGERDEAPMLYIGEEVGTGEGPEIDIALDPLEGTTLTAKGMDNALAVLSLAHRGGLLHAPDTYMDKIAVGPGLPEGVIDLDATPEENFKRLAEAREVSVDEITCCILERDRHDYIVKAAKAVGARVRMIPEGDVAGLIGAAGLGQDVDIYIGRGGAPEGVLAASALRAVGGQMQARLHFRDDDERGRAHRVGITDLDRKYDLSELASSDCLFIATGVTSGDLVDGVEIFEGEAHTHTLILDSTDHSVRRIRTSRPIRA
jgi:fructose-1,6-bisphosphatase II / sedoheptulose-1,7-bisphosphatase